MTRIRRTAVLLLASHFALIACQPYGASMISSLESKTAKSGQELSAASADGSLNVFGVRDDIDRVIIVARDTSTTSESTTSTTTSSTSSETSTSTSFSDTTTTSTSTTSSSTTASSTSTSTSTTSSSSSTSTQSTTSSTSTSFSSSTMTTTSSSTITTAASATSTSSGEIAEWNRKGNIAAIIFSCCLISLFSGVSIVHCAKDRAKSKRIAARELMNAKLASAEPLVASRGGSTAELIPDRSSIMFKDNPFGEQRPQTAYSAAGSSNNGWGRASLTEPQISTESSSTVNGTSNGDHQRGPLV